MVVASISACWSDFQLVITREEGSVTGVQLQRRIGERTGHLSTERGSEPTDEDLFVVGPEEDEAADQDLVTRQDAQARRNVEQLPEAGGKLGSISSRVSRGGGDMGRADPERKADVEVSVATRIRGHIGRPEKNFSFAEA